MMFCIVTQLSCDSLWHGVHFVDLLIYDLNNDVDSSDCGPLALLQIIMAVNFLSV